MYDDIIDLNRPISKRNRMSLEARAAQFAPFSALNGYDDKIKETARLTDKKIIIDDGLKEVINSKLVFINEHIKEKYLVRITYFVSDDKKDGGKYIDVHDSVKKIDLVNGIIKMTRGECIVINDILDVKCDMVDKKGYIYD